MITGKSARMLAIDEHEERERNRLTDLINKLQRSEKRLLKALGKHPRVDKKDNLINYVHILDDDDMDFLVESVNKKHKNPIHLGMVPFLNRDEVLQLLYDRKNDTLAHGLNMNSFNEKNSEQMKKLKQRIEEAGKQAVVAALGFQQFASRIHRTQRK